MHRRWATRPAVNTGGAHTNYEDSVETSVATLERPVTLIVVEVVECHGSILPDPERHY